MFMPAIVIEQPWRRAATAALIPKLGSGGGERLDDLHAVRGAEPGAGVPALAGVVAVDAAGDDVAEGPVAVS